MRITKRILSLILALLLILTLLPAGSLAAEGQTNETADEPYVFTEEDNALVENDVFAMIADVEAEELHPARGTPATPDDYARILPQVIEAIESSETYVEGSLVRNGDFIWWRASNGMACAFSPYREAVSHGWQDPERMTGEEDPEVLDALLEDLETTRAGTSSSVKVALIQPFWDNNTSPDGCLDSSFKSSSPKYKDMWQKLCKTAGCSTNYRYTLKDATVDAIAKCMVECGIVIVDSHGDTDCWTRGTAATEDTSNSSYICLTSLSGITAKDMETATGPHGKYSHAYTYNFGEVQVDGTCIANHMNGNAPKSFLYLGMCLGMASPGMYQPLRNRGVDAVFGWSRSVTFSGDCAYMETILEAINEGKTVGEAVAAAKKDHGDWDPGKNFSSLSSAQDHDAAFPIVVSSQDGYPGQQKVQNVFSFQSNWKMTSAYPLLTGTVSVTPASPVYGDKLQYSLGGTAYTLQQSGVAFTVRWERSDDGKTGWTVVSAGPMNVGVNSINKYLRAKVEANQYAGVLYSSPVFVTKAPNKSPVVKPQLWGSGTQVTVTNSQSNQEYLLLNYKKDIANLTASDWAAAKPGNGGSLTLNGTANSVNYVYTRMRETDTHYAGNNVVTANTYLGSNASLSGIQLSYALLDSNGNPKATELDEMGIYAYAKVGDIIRITAEPVPSNVTFNGVRGENWLVNSSSTNTSYGRYYTSQGCYQTLGKDQYYTTVYFRAEQQVNHLKLSAQYYYGYNSLAYDSFSLNVANSSGEYLFDSASASITVYVGSTVKDYPVKRIPDRASLSGATVVYRDGTGTKAPSVTLNGNNVSVDAENATAGSYYFDLYKNGSKISGGITVEVTQPPVDSLTLSPSTLTVHPGKSYTLTPKLVPANSGIPITWSSSNTAVATVNQGVVTVKSTADIGETATITAKAGGLQATCVLTVFGEKFGLEIDGVQVTTDNLGDILGNGVFSFDGRNTLTVNGSYSSNKRVIYNYGVDNFTICVKGNSTLTCTGSGKDAIVLHPDTTITGSGKLTVHAASGCGIYASSDDTTLTVENVTLVASGEWGIAGLSGSNGTALRIRHANVTASGGSGAICDFGGGVTIRNGTIVVPQGGRISSDGRSIVDSAGAVSGNVVIAAVENPFKDVAENKYYHDPVLWAYYHDPQITAGTSKTTFSPNDTCTRAQIVTFLWRAAGSPEPTTTNNPFKDVTSDKYYYRAVLWAVENGITSGTGKTKFSPNDSCTRAQVVTFLWRCEKQVKPKSSVNPFKDVKGNAYYYKAVLWAVENGVTSGTSKTKFSPDQACTRGQIVTFLYRYREG